MNAIKTRGIAMRNCRMNSSGMKVGRGSSSLSLSIFMQILILLLCVFGIQLRVSAQNYPTCTFTPGPVSPCPPGPCPGCCGGGGSGPISGGPIEGPIEGNPVGPIATAATVAPIKYYNGEIILNQQDIPSPTGDWFGLTLSYHNHFG